MPLRDRMIMVKRARPIQGRLPNGRTFILRYKRSTCTAIPPTVALNRPYKQIPAPKNKCPWHPVAQQQARGLGSILKFAKKNYKKSTIEKTW